MKPSNLRVAGDVFIFAAAGQLAITSTYPRNLAQTARSPTVVAFCSAMPDVRYARLIVLRAVCISYLPRLIQTEYGGTYVCAIRHCLYKIVIRVISESDSAANDKAGWITGQTKSGIWASICDHIQQARFGGLSISHS